MMGGGEKVSLSPPVVTRKVEFDQLWDVSTPHILQHTGDGVCVYTGAGNFTHDSIGTVRAKHPVDPNGPIDSRSFELQIIQPGQHNYIGIGVVSKTYPPNKLPGWKEISVGYHADNGDLFHSCEEGKPTEQPCLKGDVMKCTVEAVDKGKEVVVLFHRNGEQVGRITSWKPDNGFYFCFGMMSRDEVVQVTLPEVSEPYFPEVKAPPLEETWTLNPNVEHRGSGVCHYVKTDSDDNIGTIRSKLPLNPFGPNNYFDVKVIDPGEKGFIALGVCSEHYPMHRLPGWDDLSVGFHADDGSILSTSDQKSTGESCEAGDVIRCSITPIDRHDKQVNVTFHKNGTFIGKTLFWKPVKGGFYAQIGCMSEGEVIQVASHSTFPSSLTPGTDKSAMGKNTIIKPPLLQSQDSEARAEPFLSIQPSLTDTSIGMTSEDHGPYEGHGGPPSLPSLMGDHKGSLDDPLSPHDSGSLSSMATGGTKGTSLNPFFPPHLPHPPRGGHQPFPPFPAYFGPHSPNPRDPHFQLYNKWMRWYHYNPHAGYHGYPHHDEGFPDSQREGTNLTPEARAEASSPWRFPYPFHPFMDPSRFYPSPPRAVFPGDRPSPQVGPGDGAHRMPHLYDYAKQVSVASSASDSAPFGVSRENSNEAPPTPRSHQLARDISTPVGSSSETFNESTGDEKSSPLALYTSQMSNVSNASSSSLPLSDDQVYVESSRSAASASDVASAPSVQAKGEPRKLLFKQLPLQETDSHTSLASLSHVHDDSTLESEHNDSGDLVNTSLTPLATTAHLPDCSAASVGSAAFESGTAYDSMHTASTDTLLYSDEGEEAASIASKCQFYLQQQQSVDIIPKEENKMFQLLHNVDINEDGLFVRKMTDNIQESDNSFIMCRLPLSEKMSYFEVEIRAMSCDTSAAVAVGLVWENYPVFHFPGILPGSIGLYSNGSLNAGSCCGESINERITSAFVSGDVIGCQAQLSYKSEVSHNRPDQNNGSLVKIEFFKNGHSLAIQDVVLPPNGLHPAVGFKGQAMCIKINSQNISLSPQSYFQSHSLPVNIVNFPPPPSAQSVGWRCLKNTTVTENHKLTINEPRSGLPAVVQHSLPFSPRNFYFEVELRCHVSDFSVLAIGTLPQKSSSEVSTFIPGEAASSVGFLPLIGFIMRDGVILGAIPETITSSLYGERTCIGVGVDFRKEAELDTSMSEEIDSRDKVLVFFTINGQVMNKMSATLPKGGFYPTLAVDSDSDPNSDLAVAINFPHHWPMVDNLPFGFVRGAENGFFLSDINTICDARGKESSNATALPVRALQAAAPLSPSHSYFEIRIVDGGETYCISIGLASFTYDLSKHPGWRSESIAFHADDGYLFIDGNPEPVAPACRFKGTILGCGAKFPEDGNVRFAEVYFTVNGHLVARKFVKVPHLGFFPTIGMRTKGGIISIDLDAADTCADMMFNTVWGTKDNVKVEGDVVALAPNLQRVKRGAALLSLPLSLEKLVYFKAIPLSEISGTVMLGITTNKQCPQNFCESKPFKSCILNIATGRVMIYDNYFQTKESCIFKDTKAFGCGLEPLPAEKMFLLLFTCDDQVVFCSTIEVDSDEVYPLILMMDSSTRLKIDACALWPNMTPIGRGWARFANLKIENSILSHFTAATQCYTRKKPPVGFAQTSMPLTPSNPYFEIEVVSRSVNKSIAIGLATRKYPSNSYVGWHEESIGYHLDDGKLFKAYKHGHNFGPKAYATDTIGCGIRFVKVNHTSALKGGDNLEVFFTINGAVIGTQKFMIPCGGAFPTICLESPTESVIYHQHSEVFPPVSKLVDSRIWGNAYCVCQADRQIKHQSIGKEVCGGIPKAFCQAKEPFSMANPYFELEIVGLEPNSVIQLGPLTHIPRGCTSPNTYSVLYSSAGQIIMRKNEQKVILGTQKSGLGDRLGCALIYENSKPVSVEFYVNNMRITSKMLGWNNRLQTSDLYPTIILTHPGDAVIPSLHIPPPVADTPFLVGWLRMERIKVKSAIIEYTAAGKSITDVGVAQASQALNFNSITYYEIEILNPGKKCTISIGVAASDYSLSNQPGWKENSVAMHGDDGRLFQNSGMGTAFGPAWKRYDVIGLGIRSPTNNCLPYSRVQVYFTRNGEEIGHTSQVVPPSGLFPTIGMHSPGEKVKVHIGTQEATPNSYDPILLDWQALCGVDLKKSRDGSHILSFKDNERSRPSNLEHGIVLSVAIGNRPFSEEMHYFEVEILSKGHMGIAVGVVPTDFPLQEAPGWSHNSVAYHADDGALYHSSLRGKDFGPVPHVGDAVGCGVELVPNNTKFCFVFFTYNGFIIGRVRASLPEKGFHPGLALTSKQDKIAVRFMDAFKPRLTNADSSFIGVMRINNCSYSHQIVQFTGTGNSGYSQAPAMAQFAVPLHNNRRYFAANIVRGKDVILIGLAVKDYPMKYAPGSTSISIAYNVLRGSIKAVYGPENFLNLDAPVCRVGDTVGCGISLNETASKDEPPASVFFTKNGNLVKSVTLTELMEDLYPVVGFVPEEKSSAVFMDWNVPLFEPLNKF